MSVEVEAVGTSEAAPAALHVPVLLEETMAVLRPERGGRFVDATVGAGGHAEALLERGPAVRLLGLDRDPGALAAASLRLVRFGARVELRHAPFSGLAAAVGGEPVDGLLADLGVSSMQLDDPARGFSWRGDGGPLDMRMDPTAGAPLGEVLAGLDDEALAEALRTLGEERHARRVARAVRRALDSERGIADTAGLARVVRAAAGGALGGGRGDRWRRAGRVDSATRTFQALRMLVNDETGELRALLDAAPRLLAPGGVLCVISFHSGEDRPVKQAMRALVDGGGFERLTRKAVQAGDDEAARNPRARSAKLRAVRRAA